MDVHEEPGPSASPGPLLLLTQLCPTAGCRSCQFRAISHGLYGAWVCLCSGPQQLVSPLSQRRRCEWCRWRQALVPAALLQARSGTTAS